MYANTQQIASQNQGVRLLFDSMKSSRPMNKLFEEAHDDLAILVTRTRQLRRLTLEFRRHLDPELAPHCYISQIENDLLVVFVDSAAWATRLRFLVSQLVPKLRAATPAFSQVGPITDLSLT